MALWKVEVAQHGHKGSRNALVDAACDARRMALVNSPNNATGPPNTIPRQNASLSRRACSEFTFIPPFDELADEPKSTIMTVQRSTIPATRA